MSEEEQQNFKKLLETYELCGSKRDKHEDFVWLLTNNVSQQ